MTDEEFRAIIAAGPAVVIVESRHMIALLDERDGLRGKVEAARLDAFLRKLGLGGCTVPSPLHFLTLTRSLLREREREREGGREREREASADARAPCPRTPGPHSSASHPVLSVS